MLTERILAELETVIPVDPMREHHLRTELRYWVKYAIGRMTLHSQIGGRLTVPAPYERSRHASAAWYFDMERALSTLRPDYLRIVILGAQGHSQNCIANEIGRSLRTVVRDASLALDCLRSRMLQQNNATVLFKHLSPFKRRHLSNEATLKWLTPPGRCICKSLGRPPKER